MFRRFPILLIILLALVSCYSSDEIVGVDSINELFDSEQFSEVILEISSGQVSILQSEDSQILVFAKLANSEILEITQKEPALSIALENGNDKDEITIYIPANMEININTFSADVTIESVMGIASIRSTAGDVGIESFNGKVQLWAGRGDVTVNDGQGEVSLIGEHGVLLVDGFGGKVSMTTIMGEINYFAVSNDLSMVQLESDHGPVTVLLPRNSRSNIEVSTTSGYVTCIGEGISQIRNGCERREGEGVGDVVIRTVSGRVDLRIYDSNEGE